MEINFKYNDQLLTKVCNKVLDEYEYNGKTIREWADRISNPKTNADRIRAMSDEELAETFTCIDMFCCPVEGISCAREPDCKSCFERWLKQEAEDENV